VIAGIGIDLVDLNRMQESIQSGAFLRKVFSEAELADCAPPANQLKLLAGKFAAKEAFMKSIGLGIRQGIWFRQVEVLQDPAGKPYLRANGNAARAAEELKAQRMHVSISYAGDLVTATVILER
jgi:holo-[acyl-carrier protein] synthase